MKRALIVEDDLQNRRLFNLLSASQQCDVDSVSDGGSALDLLLERSYDVIILDLMIPTIAGNDLLAHMREYVPDMLQRTMVVSAWKAQDLYALGAEYGIPVFRKPFDLQEITQSIRDRLDYS